VQFLSWEQFFFSIHEFSVLLSFFPFGMVFKRIDYRQRGIPFYLWIFVRKVNLITEGVLTLKFRIHEQISSQNVPDRKRVLRYDYLHVFGKTVQLLYYYVEVAVYEDLSIV